MVGEPPLPLPCVQGSVIYRAKSLNGLKKHGVLAFSVWWCYNSLHGASGSPDLRR